jgi:hypothetical protein
MKNKRNYRLAARIQTLIIHSIWHTPNHKIIQQKRTDRNKIARMIGNENGAAQ